MNLMSAYVLYALWIGVTTFLPAALTVVVAWKTLRTRATFGRTFATVVAAVGSSGIVWGLCSLWLAVLAPKDVAGGLGSLFILGVVMPAVVVILNTVVTLTAGRCLWRSDLLQLRSVVFCFLGSVLGHVISYALVMLRDTHWSEYEFVGVLLALARRPWDEYVALQEFIDVRGELLEVFLSIPLIGIVSGSFCLIGLVCANSKRRRDLG